MARDNFPDGVAAQLKWYVYRLIDPRNGETFYVGKGQGDRVFAHAKGQMPEGDEVLDSKLQRIKEIQSAGLEVSHVIHRHGISTQDRAYEVEAAVIDAYPGLTNKTRGHGARDYGSRHVEEIIDEYAGEEFEDQGTPITYFHWRLLLSAGRPIRRSEICLEGKPESCEAIQTGVGPSQGIGSRGLSSNRMATRHP